MNWIIASIVIWLTYLSWALYQIGKAVSYHNDILKTKVEFHGDQNLSKEG